MSTQDRSDVQAVADAAARIEARARELGFHAVGFAPASQPPADDYERFRAFLDAGLYGEMDYLARTPEVRSGVDSDAIVAGAKTVVCLAQRYDRAEPGESSGPSLENHIARYARGRDYHGFLRKRLGKLAAYIAGLGDDVAARAFCNAGPVLEQAWAVRAGLGFVGKNGLLILAGRGSFCLLGEVVTTLAVPPEAYGRPVAEQCGTCTACLDGCPTGAFEAPYVLDPRRCIAYLTIESRTAPPAALRDRLGEHLFGCDDCQTVCPHNHGLEPPAPETTAPFAALARWTTLGLADLVTLDEAGFREVAQGSPVKRAGRVGLARNAVLLAAHRRRHGDAAAAEVLRLAAAHDDPDVAALARQALDSGRRRRPLS